METATEGRESNAQALLIGLPLFPLLVLAQLFLFVTGAYLFGPEWSSDGALLYIAMVLGALALAQYALGAVPEERRAAYRARLVPTAPVLEGAAQWWAGFLVTYAVVLVLFELVMGYDWPAIAPTTALVMVYFTVFFVAPSEELLFRGVLPNLHVERYVLGVPVLLVASQAVFALFHMAAYGGLGVSMFVTFGLGMVWVFAARRLSLYATMGSHAAYNLCVLGVLTGGV